MPSSGSEMERRCELETAGDLQKGEVGGSNPVCPPLYKAL